MSRVVPASDHVARGAGLWRDDGALAADELIQKCGLADVGAADDGDVDIGAILGCFAFGKIGCERIEKLVDAETVL